jgi:hypothetical protein
VLPLLFNGDGKGLGGSPSDIKVECGVQDLDIENIGLNPNPSAWRLTLLDNLTDLAMCREAHLVWSIATTSSKVQNQMQRRLLDKVSRKIF